MFGLFEGCEPDEDACREPNEFAPLRAACDLHSIMLNLRDFSAANYKFKATGPRSWSPVPHARLKLSQEDYCLAVVSERFPRRATVESMNRMDADIMDMVLQKIERIGVV